ncbi:type II secretion system F family protein [Xanthobacter dioxanivorans]|uniref:Type II secretion system F family protein n=1 Tax=Xanthobacter dioxanivorans TaxID=2528964 RepID=A0A974PR98_9HYPH|nr:type II secretion system F family protein [Xanthobacter dioxanivorans]QRG06045.1 type II secretion system F family protein [Xanthobacter dioxanivorans]QRG08071.1 type II secretion system F family protein [Xanthobacter dioxanivorans]
MADFTYRALTQAGQLVTGRIAGTTEAEVRQRIEFLGLVPVETAPAREAASAGRFGLSFGAPRAADVTLFTRDLALLLKAGARLDEALELLCGDADLGRMRAVAAGIRAEVLSGAGFAEAVAAQPKLFPPVYVALVRVGEASGTLDRVLELLAQERARAEELRRKLLEALQYPAFVLVAAGGVLVFFLLFVMPQFSSVLRDMGAKLDPAVEVLLDLSDILQAHAGAVAAGMALLPLAGWAVLRRPATRAGLLGALARLPLVRTVLQFRRSAVFCRNLSILLGNGVTLTTALRIIVEVMAAGDDASAWATASDKVRHGGRLSDAFAQGDALPPMAIRMLRLGEETGQLALLSGRIADFYEEKLQRALGKVVAVIGPAAIVTISVVVGGLIVSVMTALLSVSQSIG